MNDLSVKCTNILVLKGVRLADIENFVSRTVGQEPAEDLTHVKFYDALPAKFTTVADWPEQTNLSCWHCAELFEARPAFLPTRPAVIDGVEVYEAVGNFCSWNCAVRYVDIYYPKDVASDIRRFIAIMYKKFTGRTAERIMPSPDRVIMKKYAGDSGISAEDYRKKIANLDVEYQFGDYKLCHLTENSRTQRQ